MCPIDVKTFEAKGETPSGRKAGQTRPQIEKFLYDNKNQAFTTREIAEKVGGVKATVNHTVRKLTESGKVERKEVDGLIYNRWVSGEPNLTPDDEDEEVDDEK
jgi:predicted transcriptional regulator